MCLLRAAAAAACDLELRHALVARACRDICTSCDPIEVTADTDATGCHWPAHDGCSAAGSRRTASARSGCIGSTMRAPSYAIEHHRSKPSPEPILHRATKRLCFCEMLSAAATDPRRAALARMTSLADSDPKARSALHTRKGVESTQFTSMASLGRIGDTAQSVRASDARPWLQSDDATILIPQRNNFDSRMQQF